jgi:hypothetical protein
VDSLSRLGQSFLLVTKLAATILLMNLCTVHGVSNNFADELFTIMHCHLLSAGYTLPRNHYAAKTLTTKLGLVFALCTWD